MTRISILGAGASLRAASIASLLAEHAGAEVLLLNEAPLRLPSLSEFPVNKPQRGKVNTRTDYPGLTDEQRAWNQAIDKRKAEKAARRTSQGEAMKDCFFGKKPPPEMEFFLRVLDCSDVMHLASLYGEARDDFKSPKLMAAVNERLAEVLGAAPTSPTPAQEGKP